MGRTKNVTKYANNFFSVSEGTFHINNSDHKYFAIDKADVVAVLPITNDGKIILERQFRPAVKKNLYEIPAGHIDNGESPRHAALRELEEETGYRAGKLEYIAKIYGSPGLLDEVQYLFLAKMLRKGKKHLDPMEDIKIKIVTEWEAMGMIRNKKINDAKTIVALLYFRMLKHMIK